MAFPLKKNQIKQKRKQGGFTLIELIIVILLLSITAIYSSSAYIGASRFSSAAAQEQVLSILRHVQMASMQTNTGQVTPPCRSIFTENDQFGVDRTCQKLGMSSAVLSDYSKESDRERLTMIQLSYAFNTSKGDVSISELSFDRLGRPRIPALPDVELCTQEDCRITITTTSSSESRSVCINNEGFMYRSSHHTVCEV